MTIKDLSSLRNALAPNGRIRYSINLGNPILAGRDASTGQLFGVSVDLARLFAERLGVEVELVAFDAAGEAVKALREQHVDIGFFAIDPARSEGIRFTPPYVQIEGCYMVRIDSPIHINTQVDVPGRKVVVGAGSAYDLFLTRELKNAQILRAATSPTVVEVLLEQSIDVAAGVKQQLEADARRFPGVRLLPERFMVIHQAMGIPSSRNDHAFDFLKSFVEEMKASGFIANALAAHRIEGATVAPAGYPPASP
ncbi:ABC transporter substrate-binding protein [Polaromonas jejuensis]|uniref:ABC transporter substrate-binding protein n=1 Tax=Polaromonas jejuensis TaxID=457502 RepID=A0ABW0QCF9_9BURK|nr:ABC transporter substrate-binding protein [Polaromonas jejuensis]